MIDVEQALAEKFPRTFGRASGGLRVPFVAVLRRVLREREVNALMADNGHLQGFEFVERVLDHFDFSYSVTDADRRNVPAQGRVVIVANHPLGGLDALGLLRMVGEVRRDVRVLANDMLWQLEPMRRLLIPVDNMGGRIGRGAIGAVSEALGNEQAVIVFPAGEVSRLRPQGLRDARWRAGFLRFARKARAPVLPVYLQARNSALFYTASMLARPLSTALLVREMFYNRTGHMPIRVGELIPAEALEPRGLSTKAQCALVRKHVYRIGAGRKGLLRTEKAIAHPESRQALKSELRAAAVLGQTGDGKRILLFEPTPDSAVLREIGRLREISFRKVGEGTGRRRDLDVFDTWYRHIVLWDEEALEIVGAYRIGESRSIMSEHGREGFYTNSLFPFTDRFGAYLGHAIELGRSFVQPRYWGSRALDYLWQGIGAYLARHPEVEYLFGFPAGARALLMRFYSLYFGDDTGLVATTRPYRLTSEEHLHAAQAFGGGDYAADFRRLKEQLGHYGLQVPTLFKQYSELCEAGGVRFLDFGVDPDFGDCVDAFILVETARIRAQKRERYIEPARTPVAA